jgi:hypothetical protein
VAADPHLERPYEATAPKHDWPAWYAAYIVAREHGRTPDAASRNAALHVEALVSGLHPMRRSIGTFPTRLEAETVQGLLASAGIDAWVAADDAGGAYPFDLSGGPQVLIDERDLETALQVRRDRARRRLKRPGKDPGRRLHLRGIGAAARISIER